MKRADVAHDHLQLERALRTINQSVNELTTDGRDVIEVLDAMGALNKAMTEHHQDEEERLFKFAARSSGKWDADLKELVAQHRALETALSEVIELITDEGDIGEAKDKLLQFNRAFDVHTLAEADYFSTRWDELFPGEIMAG